jgi:hypothetical protein
MPRRTPRQGNSASLQRVVAQRRDQGARLLHIAGLPALAEHVGRQGKHPEFVLAV